MKFRDNKLLQKKKPFEKIFNFSDKNFKRDQRILSKVNLKKLPFKISLDNLRVIITSPLMISFLTTKVASGCLSTEKKMKVFLLIFEANEQGREIYKENISTKLPEYSYKTIAQIVDEGLEKDIL